MMLEPSDEELIKFFSERKADLERLSDLRKKDIELTNDLVRQKPETWNARPTAEKVREQLQQLAPHKEHISEYMSLLKRAGVELVMPLLASTNNQFFCLTLPQQEGDFIKGYAFCPEDVPQARKADNLDQVDGESGLWLRLIEGDWFIFVMRRSKRP